ncbi:MAG: nitrous oxide reductase family maturation protein NosD [Thermoanaerobaculia bacterium]
MRRAAAALAPVVTAALLAGAARADQMAGVAPGTLEGRPAPEETSPVQALIDRAAPGSTVVVPAGRYVGDLVVDRPLHLVGQGRPLLVASGAGSVVRVRADDVTVEGFEVDGREIGDLGRDSAGVHVAASRVTVRSCRIRRTIFGVYLREAHGVTVEDCDITGIPGRDPGEKGSGIHIWNTTGFTFRGNRIEDVRDGIYIQSATHGLVEKNVARNLRYGLHYMFSDDNVFRDNVFENGDAGTAIMYSKRIRFERNRFLHNRGFASVGLLFQTCDDVVAEDNLLADNARGIFIEDSYRNVFRRNVVAESDTALVVYGSCGENRFEGNSFLANLTPLTLVGKRTDTVFDGNYWSENDEPDLDGDGRSDRPYRLSNVFDHLRGNLLAADLFAQSFAATAIGVAERTFPVLEQVAAVDHAPLARPPDLPAVPTPDGERGRASFPGLAASFGALLGGSAILLVGRRR